MKKNLFVDIYKYHHQSMGLLSQPGGRGAITTWIFRSSYDPGLGQHTQQQMIT